MTNIFRISPATYVRAATGIWLGRGGWLLFLPPAAALVAGLADWRWFVVALALVCLIYPGIMALIYFSHALRPGAAMATIPHSIAVSDSGIDITYHPAGDTPAPPPRHIDRSDISAMEDTGSCLMLTLGNNRYDLLLIPTAEIKHGFMPRFMDLQPKNNKSQTQN